MAASGALAEALGTEDLSPPPWEGTKVVAVMINKGGAGKTMLVRSLATAAANAGLFVLILDLDSQENATSWRKRRPKELLLPAVEYTTEKSLEEALNRARNAGCHLVLLDTPPGRSAEAAAAAEEGDLILIPCTSETECFEGLPRTARLARSATVRAVVVPNFVHPSGLAEEQTIRDMAEANKLETAPVALHEYQVHRDGSFAGKTAQELQPDSRPAKEISALWDWLCAQLQKGTTEQLHKA